MGADLDAIAGLVVAILGGAAVGVERQQSGHASGPDARLGGVRTFTLPASSPASPDCSPPPATPLRPAC